MLLLLLSNGSCCRFFSMSVSNSAKTQSLLCSSSSVPVEPLLLLMLLPPQNNGKVNCEIAAQSGMGLLVAGNDTSGQGVSAILATLQYFPKVLDKIRQEQQKVRHAACHMGCVLATVVQLFIRVWQYILYHCSTGPMRYGIGRQMKSCRQLSCCHVLSKAMAAAADWTAGQ